MELISAKIDSRRKISLILPKEHYNLVEKAVISMDGVPVFSSLKILSTVFGLPHGFSFVPHKFCVKNVLTRGIDAELYAELRGNHRNRVKNVPLNLRK